jgi:hypothetical protein
VRATCVPAASLRSALAAGVLCWNVGQCDPILAVDFEPSGLDRVVLIDTPEHSHAFTGCAIEALWVARHGTVFTVIADCTGRSSTPQATGWLPTPHPDLAPQFWEGRMRLDGTPQIFEQCVLLDHRDAYGQAQTTAECLDDPY